MCYYNLYTRGNTGSASILIMLVVFLATGRALPGHTIVCMVPESGRFKVTYIHLTVVEEGNE
jgi:3-oxoacyl-[acyl-carrier-protein] synthase-3